MRTRFVKLTATFFYIGYAPKAPGSVASLAGVLFYGLWHAQPAVYLSVLIALTVIGFWTSGAMARSVNEDDPSCVVIDEVAGMMLALLFVPMSPWVLAAGYVLFRVFDIFKFYPINKLESVEGGAGIMLDDLMAGLYVNIILRLLLLVIH